MRWLLKRWWFWGGAGFMLVAVCAGYLLIPVREGRISQPTCDRIVDWMPREEVLSILGEPSPLDIEPVRSGGKSGLYVWWIDDDGASIRVLFNDKGQVCGARYFPSDESIWEKTKCRIERRIRALWP